MVQIIIFFQSLAKKKSLSQFIFQNQYNLHINIWLRALWKRKSTGLITWMQIYQILTNQICYETKRQKHHISVGFILGMQCWCRASQEVVVAKSLLANVGDAERPECDPWVRKIPWRRKWQTTPVLLPGKSHGQKSLGGYSPCKVRHDWVTFTITSIIALRITYLGINLQKMYSVCTENSKSLKEITEDWNECIYIPWALMNRLKCIIMSVP